MKDYKEAIESIMKDTTSKVMDHAIKAYRQGYENGLGKAQTDSYVKGYEDGQKEKLANAMIHDHEVAEKTAYEDGMNAAWDAAKKIIENVFLGGYRSDELREIFGVSEIQLIFKRNTANEALAKIKAYEDKQKDKVKETDLERKPPKADCDKCAQKGFCGHPEPIKEVVRENGCYGFIPY